MKNKILVFSMALLVCSFAEAEADSVGSVGAYADLDWSLWTVTGASGYVDDVGDVADFYFNQSSARTAAIWDITTQPEVVPVPVYNTDSTFKNSSIWVGGEGGYYAATATGKTGIDEYEDKLIASESTVQLLSSSYGSYSAEATALRGQSYEVTTPGTTVTFSIPYVVDVVLSGNDDIENEYGVAMAWIHLRQYDWGLGDWSSVLLAEKDFTIIGAGHSESVTSLFLSYTFNSIDTINGTYVLFEAGADTRVAIENTAPVPVPPSVLMLLTGCTSLFFLKRRKG
jgi:hypothetical protein